MNPFFDPDELRLTAQICVGGIVLLLGLYLLGRILTRNRKESVIPVMLPLGAVAAILVMGSFYLDTRPSVTGVVLDKWELINIDSDGLWENELTLRVAYTPPNASTSQTNDLDAKASTYDAVAIGDEVDVRFLDAGGLFEFARLADRSTMSMILGLRALYLPLVLVVGAVLSWAVAVLTNRKASGILTFVVLAFLLMVFGSYFQIQGNLPLASPQQTAVATVRQVERFTRLKSQYERYSSRPLLQHFDVVKVEFTPEGWDDPILAADRIDADSTALEAGGTVTVRYSMEQPRQIRLQDGARTYIWKNGIVGVLFLSLAVFFLTRMIRRQVIQRRQPSNHRPISAREV